MLRKCPKSVQYTVDTFEVNILEVALTRYRYTPNSYVLVHVTIHFASQLDGIQNHNGNKPRSNSVRDFLGEVDEPRCEKPPEMGVGSLHELR